MIQGDLMYSLPLVSCRTPGLSIKTKDLHILQQLLGHSDMIVTLKYLRGLAAIKNDDLKAVMPTLNF
jgi:hypothetical protein